MLCMYITQVTGTRRSPLQRNVHGSVNNVCVGKRASLDPHFFETTTDACDDVGLFRAGSGVVYAWRIDDHHTLPFDLGLDDVDIAGTRLQTVADLLLL